MSYLKKIVLLSYVLLISFTLIMCKNPMNEKEVDYKYLKDNFLLKEKEIFRLKEFCKKNIPKNMRLQFEFGDDANSFDINITIIDTFSNKLRRDYKRWKEIKLGSSSCNLVCKELNWNQSQFGDLIKLLKSTNCIGIASQHINEDNSPFQLILGYGKGNMYTYELYDQSLTEKVKLNYRNRQGFTVYRDDVVFHIFYW
ncbi:hypothetical protein D3C87_29190 [compost metagenome]